MNIFFGYNSPHDDLLERYLGPCFDVDGGGIVFSGHSEAGPGAGRDCGFGCAAGTGCDGFR